MRKFILNLLRFGEGGDGGAGSASGEAAPSGENNSGENIPSSIPERGRKLFAEVLKQTSASVKEQPAAVEAEDEKAKETSKPTYDELIKSEDYKEAHKEYMEKTINDRLKRYKGQEQSLKEAQALLNTIGTRYGLNSEDKDYMAKLTEAINNDDYYYEKYAEENDMTPAEARKIVSLERRVKEAEAERQRIAAEETQRAQFDTIRQNASRTQSLYPGFDLATELQNPKFVGILSATNGDTTAAYVAAHHNDIIKGVVANVAQQTQVATTNAIASGTKRPPENGLSGSAASDVNINFKNMSLAELRAYAEQQRRMQKR